MASAQLGVSFREVEVSLSVEDVELDLNALNEQVQRTFVFALSTLAEHEVLWDSTDASVEATEPGFVSPLAATTERAGGDVPLFGFTGREYYEVED